MTEVVPASSSDVELYGGGSTGLEDIGAGDVIIPRLRIVHADGVFENNLSKERFDTIKCVILGLVKQRIMWPEEVDDKDKPQCKSPDFDHGFPNTFPGIPADKQFPWAKSNFDLGDAQTIEIDAGVDPAYPAGYSSHGYSTLPCANCIFKEWDKGDWKTPPCNEQHTYPLLYVVNEGTEDEDLRPALITFAKSGIKPSKSYLSAFAQTNTPMFTVFTELSLDPQSRGTNKFAVPKFKKLDSTDRDDWPAFGMQMRQIRNFVRSAPRTQEGEVEEETATPAAVPAENSPAPASPAAKAAPKPPAPKPATPEPPADDDDLPF